MDTQQAREALSELAAAAPVLGVHESAVRARQILDRANLAPLDIVDYLTERGYEEVGLVRAVARMATPLARAYRAEYGHDPVKKPIVVAGVHRYVHTYVELDRPVFDRVYAEVFEQ